MDRISRIHIAKVPYEISTDAQELLHKYLRAIKSKLDESIADEVISDVEVRITQILTDRKVKPGDVITEEDIRAVQEKLGSPEQFTDSEDKEPSEAGEKPRRLMRDLDGAYICGVASGLGAYFGVDPIFVRIAFVLLTFVSGLGILLYILFWILVPAAKTPAEQLEMTGRPVTLDTLRDYRENVRNNLSEGRTSAQRFFLLFGRILLAVGRLFCAVIFIAFILFVLTALGAITSAALFVSPFKGLFASYHLDFLGLGLVWAFVISISGLLLILLRGLFAKGNAITRAAAMAFGGILLASIVAGVSVGVVTANHFTQVYGNGRITTALNITNQDQIPVTSLEVKSDKNLSLNYIVASGPERATYQAYPGLGSPSLSLVNENGVLVVDSNNLAKAAPSCFGTLCSKIYLPIRLTIYGPSLNSVKDESGANVTLSDTNLPQSFIVTSSGGSNVSLVGSFGENVTISATHDSSVDAGSTTVQSASITVDDTSNVISPSTSSLTANVPQDCSVMGSPVVELNSLPDQSVINGRILAQSDLNTNDCVQLGTPVPPPPTRIMKVSPARFR